MSQRRDQDAQRQCPLCGERFTGAPLRCPRDGAALVPVEPAQGPAPPDEDVSGSRSRSGESPPSTPPEDPTDHPLIGRVLSGRYEILRHLATGGMGDIYAARQLTMDREVAVKVLRPQLGRDRALVERFLREVRAASQLHHPNTIRVFDVGEADGVLFMVLEILHGEPLSAIIERDAPLDPSRAVHLVSQVCDALSEAHARGVIHLDIKPDNLHVESRFGLPEHVKLLDFGVSSVQSLAKRSVDASALAGTPEYMSPEQIRGEEPDARADIYAVGAVLHELLTGRPPFEGKTPFAILVKQLNDPVPPLPVALRGKVPDTLWAVTRRLLSKSAQDRPSSAAEVRELLARAMSDRRARQHRSVPSVITQTLRFGANLSAAIQAREAEREATAQSPAAVGTAADGDPASARPTASSPRREPDHGANPSRLTPSRVATATGQRNPHAPRPRRLTPGEPSQTATRRATPSSIAARHRTPMGLRSPSNAPVEPARGHLAPPPAQPGHRATTPLPGQPAPRRATPSRGPAVPTPRATSESVVARRHTDRARRTSSQVRTPTAPKPMGTARDSSVRKRLSLKSTRVSTRHEASGSRFDILASNAEECVLHSLGGVPPSVGRLILAGAEPRVSGIDLVVDIPHAGPSNSPGKGLVRAKWLEIRSTGRRDRLVQTVTELLGREIDASAFPSTVPLHQELVYDVASDAVTQRPKRPSQSLAVADRGAGGDTKRHPTGPGVSRARRVTSPSAAPEADHQVETPWGSKKR